MKAMDILKRPALKTEEKPRVTALPPNIPPQIPTPKTGEYAKLMKRHDAAATRRARQS